MAAAEGGHSRGDGRDWTSRRVYRVVDGWLVIYPRAPHAGRASCADKTPAPRETRAQIQIRGGRITCTLCSRGVAGVVLLEPDRPLCANCVDGRHAAA